MVIAMDAGRYVAGFDVMDVALMFASMVVCYFLGESMAAIYM